jgi:hypothetical protein
MVSRPQPASTDFGSVHISGAIDPQIGRQGLRGVVSGSRVILDLSIFDAPTR